MIIYAMQIMLTVDCEVQKEKVKETKNQEYVLSWTNLLEIFQLLEQNWHTTEIQFKATKKG